MSNGTAFSERTNPERVRELINFAGNMATYESLVELQARGTAAIYNRLCSPKKRFAYLADEVGMGKTYEALGVASLVWAQKPDARIVFISPRANLQEKWERDFTNFYRENYEQRVGVGRSRVAGQPAVNGCRPDNLRDFAVDLRLPGRRAFFLRMTSFTRPVAVFERDGWPESRDKAAAMMRRVGLDDEAVRGTPNPGSKAKFSHLNVLFASEMRRLLESLTHEEGHPALDLLVVDEAQSLRNPETQTNAVLRKIFSDHDAEMSVVDRWLFLSATPVHGSRDDVSNAIRVANPGYTRLERGASDTQFRKELKEFMVRRPRTYSVSRNGAPATLTKVDYRDHRVEDDAWVVNTMSAESALAMALVQKKLVKVLAGQSNRFKIGYLSSFESLHSSLRTSAARATPSGTQDPGTTSDHEHLEGDGAGNDEPADAEFVQRLGDDYFKRFKRTLPHAKLERVVTEVSRRAWERGEKALIFTRRINTAEELAQRLEETHEDAVVARIRECWGRILDWEVGLSGIADAADAIDQDVPVPADHEDVEAAVGGDEGAVVRTRRSNGLRSAFKPDQWLERYRNTYRSGRNALVFHENWFLRLCQVGGRDPRQAAQAVPAELWQESHAHASKFGRGGTTRIDPVARTHYLATQLIDRHPELFGIDPTRASDWAEFLKRVYPSAAQRASVGSKSSASPADDRLLLYRGFWEHWFERGDRELDGMLRGDHEALATRQCAMNWIGQSLRLTDVLIDLRCAEAAGGDSSGPYQFDWLEGFFGFLHGTHAHATHLLARCRDWAAHADVIIRNCFKVESSRLELAKKGSYEELNMPAPVVRVVGGRPQPRAIKQFKMPYYPLVVVCTDVLKEGEDLHVFCDQVVHYGVAWTSGDLEQRVGRVDRFFSQIERRVKESPDAKLPIVYPHVFGSIERRQVLTVRQRVRTAESLLGDIGLKRSESREIDLSDTVSPAREHTAPSQVVSHPFDVRPEDFAPAAPAIVVAPGHRDESHPAQLQALLEGSLRSLHDGEVIPLSAHAPRRRDLMDLRWSMAPDRSADLRWDFVPELGCYALTAGQEATGDEDEIYGAYYESVSEGDKHKDRLDRLVFPAEADAQSHESAIRRFFSYVTKPTVVPSADADRVNAVGAALCAVPGAQPGTITTKGHRVSLMFDALPGRKQLLTAYVYDEMVLFSSVACRVSKAMTKRFGEGGKGAARLQSWVHDENARLRTGYIHHHRPDTSAAALCFCERIFHWPMGATLSKLVRDLVLYADGLEVWLAHGDDEE